MKTTNQNKNLKNDTESSLPPILKQAHAFTSDSILKQLASSLHGLSHSEAIARLEKYGLNTLPKAKSPSVFVVFMRQFASPLIYVLFAAAVLSIFIQEWSDAGFIFAVLLINAIIGTTQEYSAQQSATALQSLVQTNCRVLREGDTYEIDSQQLVPGDIILLESGDRVPADARLLTSHDLEVDESLLTGESVATFKVSHAIISLDASLGDRRNMAFAGSLVMRGRGQAVVVATALTTVIGHIAAEVLTHPSAQAPLLVRMKRFTHWVALFVGVIAIIMLIVGIMRGMLLTEIFLLAVALAVSAIPEGLPVALTVALSIGMRRMAKRNVIVRRLVAVEALGSCTFIATDKTGTLTINQLTARRIINFNGDIWEVGGEGIDPTGSILSPRGALSAAEMALLERQCLAAVLPNEGFLGHRDNHWISHGDAVDVSLLVLAHKAGIIKEECLNAYPELNVIPFESEHQFSASLNHVDHQHYAFVKGAVEKLVAMCTKMATTSGDVAIDSSRIEDQAHKLALQGYRIIAVASGNISPVTAENFSFEHLHSLTFLGLIGMIDPLRVEAKAAIAACRDAGIKLAMVTGDHPTTALAIAKELELAQTAAQVITGPALKKMTDQEIVALVNAGTQVFARVEPKQKLDIVHALQNGGHFVAVTGDGANDAPALKAAHVGVAMGKNGTDVARESADLIITDDNFASIVAGIEEGRVAYANVRKVIFLLISTGAAELVLFTLALLSGLPLPLFAVQLLWLNLVTNGIQDIALAFEPAEGNELQLAPRPPRERIFNRLMIERVVISALMMGCVAFIVFQQLLQLGYSVIEARNATLLLMVLFENIHVFNCRSETRSALKHNPWENRFLLIGTLAAQLIHIGAMYTPWINEILNIQPVSPQMWFTLLFFAFSVLVVMELHKLVRRRFKLA